MKLAAVAVLCSFGVRAENLPSPDINRMLPNGRKTVVSGTKPDPRRVVPRRMSEAEREELRQAVERFVREQPGLLIDVRTGKRFESQTK